MINVFLNAINDNEIQKNIAISNCDFNNEFNLNIKFNDVFWLTIDADNDWSFDNAFCLTMTTNDN